MNQPVNILVLGSGGREHALAWKIAQSSRAATVYVGPGNPGMFRRPGKIQPALINGTPLSAVDSEAIILFCRIFTCDLVVVGPEAPLAAGVVDDLQAAGIMVFGPSRSAARLESSKAFARHVMQRAGVPSPGFSIVREWNDLPRAIEAWPWARGMVIKVDGLAAGKGVFVCRSRDEAWRAVGSLKLMDSQSAGTMTRDGLVCEELLIGREVSAFAICDGRAFIPFGMACDHKRLLDGDFGPNTGGMGAYSPVDWLDESVAREIGQIVFQPVLDEMDALGSPFRGVLFAGLMITDEGAKVLEFNVRLGDPECQVLLPRLDEDLLGIILAATTGRLAHEYSRGFKWHPGAAVHVVKAAEGYPGIDGVRVRAGDPVFETVPVAEGGADNLVFYAGVAKRQGANFGDKGDLKSCDLETSGGRVLGITAVGPDLRHARDRVYSGIDDITFEGAQWRTDIGKCVTSP
ncbi:phosphoribosylamine--glycine ligase [bacterium]|nr:phosphoribosylamine--glycine ligase [bacterium]